MEKLTAKEAAKISEMNAVKIEIVLENIKMDCENGRNISLSPILSEKVKFELMELGYSIGKTTDNFGMEHTKISW